MTYKTATKTCLDIKNAARTKINRVMSQPLSQSHFTAHVLAAAAAAAAIAACAVAATPLLPLLLLR